MQKVFDFFDAVFCINLNKRKDRWKLAQEEFDDIGILEQVKRFSAIEKKDGRLGVIKSHLEIIKYAKNNNLNNVLVFEDDVVFLDNNFQKSLQNAISQLPLNWDLFYLGANLHVPLDNYSENLVKLKNGFAAHAITYNKNIFDNFIQKYDALSKIVLYTDILDVWLADYIQNRNNSYLVKPLLATQRNSYSDIEKYNVNYSFIEERYKKFVR